MSRGDKIAGIAFFLVLALIASNQGKSAVIAVYETAPSPVRYAVGRLSQYTRIPAGKSTGREPVIRIELHSPENPRIGAQGYTIRSGDGEEITICGNHADGAANGIYTLLRILMIEHRRDPFSRRWEIEEKPQFNIRTMQVAPYRFGGSYGFAALSPDRWSLEEWKVYIDWMRLCNMTTLCMASQRTYHPDYPQSWREKWRYEVWKQVMEHCHRVGMKFNWYFSANQVAEQVFWDHPDKRAVQDAGNWWYGNGLIWSKGKDLILKNQRYSLEYFRGLDGLEVIYTDGGALSLDDATGGDPAGYFADATRSYLQLMKDSGNGGEFVYWNWLMDFWSRVMLPEPVLQKYPKLRTMQDDVIPLLPKNVAWLDASLLTIIQTHANFIQARGNPPLREGLLIGKENGFRSVIDFFWFMNPEFSISMLPHPLIRRTIQEAQYARDEIGANGVEGYRLAPPCKFIEDYAFFRLASDPTLTEEQLVGELAGLLAEKPQNQEQAKEAILTLEQFWTSHQLADLEKSEKLFRELLREERSKNLEYVSQGVTFLTFIVRLAQPGLSSEEKTRLKWKLYQTLKSMYIFQGLTADVVWVPEAVRFFFSRIDMMVEDYQSPMFGGCPYPEVVDRAIYPQATSKPFPLQWPKGLGEKKP